jgi:hypothetical protein
MRALWRIIESLVLLAVVSVGSFHVYYEWLDRYHRTITGSIAIQDAAVVYEGGVPLESSRQGGIRNGCRWMEFAIGTPVTLTELDGTPLATGKIVTTIHWEGEENGTVVASRDAHGCMLRYEVVGVPRRDAYAVVINGTTFLPAVEHWRLYSSGEGEYYIIPKIEIGL